MKDLFWVAFRNYLRRISRDPFGMLIFVALPVLLVYVLSFIYTQNAADEIYVNGYNMASTHIAVGMMLMFQLNGGIYLLTCLNHDLIQPMKWRLKAAPCATHTLVFAGTAACLIFNIAQGLLVVFCTIFFLDAYWGNLWITALVIVLISIISQLISMVFLLYMRNVSKAEYISWAVAWVMAVFGGLMFELPNNAFFRFMREYGTPFSLAQTAIRESGFLGKSSVNGLICLAILLGVTFMMSLTVILLGRRKIG